MLACFRTVCTKECAPRVRRGYVKSCARGLRLRTVTKNHPPTLGKEEQYMQIPS